MPADTDPPPLTALRPASLVEPKAPPPDGAAATAAPVAVPAVFMLFARFAALVKKPSPENVVLACPLTVVA
ncbi:hypothetical protein I552_6873 [Mycobacterium xenopi 3993]|nr:hypothetical protein I552_6873 [Mycobacterium xenopi 3993]